MKNKLYIFFLLVNSGLIFAQGSIKIEYRYWKTGQVYIDQSDETQWETAAYANANVKIIKNTGCAIEDIHTDGNGILTFPCPVNEIEKIQLLFSSSDGNLAVRDGTGIALKDFTSSSMGSLPNSCDFEITNLSHDHICGPNYITNAFHHARTISDRYPINDILTVFINCSTSRVNSNAYLKGIRGFCGIGIGCAVTIDGVTYNPGLYSDVIHHEYMHVHHSKITRVGDDSRNLIFQHAFPPGDKDNDPETFANKVATAFDEAFADYFAVISNYPEGGTLFGENSLQNPRQLYQNGSQCSYNKNAHSMAQFISGSFFDLRLESESVNDISPHIIDNWMHDIYDVINIKHIILINNNENTTVANAGTNLLEEVIIRDKGSLPYVPHYDEIYQAFTVNHGIPWPEGFKRRPDSPTGLTAVAVSHNQINLSWTDNSNVPNDEENFIIECRCGTQFAPFIIEIDPNTTSFSHTGLQQNTWYEYKIASRRQGLDSEWSNTVSATTQPYCVVPPTGLSGWALSSSEVRLNWSNYNNDASAVYVYRFSTNGFNTITALNKSETLYTDSGLNAGETYTYHLRAYYNGVYSAPSNEISVTLPEPTVIVNAPQIQAVNCSNSQAEIIWADNSDNEDAFVIEYKYNSLDWTEISEYVSPNSTSFLHTNLQANTVYSWRMRAKSGSDYSQYSNVIQGETPPGPGVPSAPASLAATTVSDTRIYLTWNDNSDNEDGFRVECKPEGGTYTQIAETGPRSSGTASFTSTNLTPSTTYIYRVRAFNSSGNSSYSQEASAETQTPISSLTLLMPNGGESFEAGSTFLVKWESYYFEAYVNIEYSSDDGNQWETLAESTTNDGLELCQLPNVVSGACRIRISDTASGAISDLSDAVFNLYPQGEILPMNVCVQGEAMDFPAPNGQPEDDGEKYRIPIGEENAHYINFTGTTLYRFMISGRSENGSTKSNLQILIDDAPAGELDLSYGMASNVYQITSGTHKVSVKCNITPFFLNQIEINTAEPLILNDQVNIDAAPSQFLYATGGMSNDVMYDYHDGEEVGHVINFINAGDNRFDIYAYPHDTLDIYIDDVFAGSYGSLNYAVNSITLPVDAGVHKVGLRARNWVEFAWLNISHIDDAITVESPNGGESFEKKSSTNICWTSENFSGNVKLEFSTDSGANWVIINPGTSNDGTESWVIPDITSNTCKIRVSDAADGSPSDVSDAVFAVTGPAPIVTMNIRLQGESMANLAPNGQLQDNGQSYYIPDGEENSEYITFTGTTYYRFEVSGRTWNGTDFSTIQLLIDDEVIGSVDGEYGSWSDVYIIPNGTHKVSVLPTVHGFLLNWLDLKTITPYDASTLNTWEAEGTGIHYRLDGDFSDMFFHLKSGDEMGVVADFPSNGTYAFRLWTYPGGSADLKIDGNVCGGWSSLNYGVNAIHVPVDKGVHKVGIEGQGWVQVNWINLEPVSNGSKAAEGRIDTMVEIPKTYALYNAYPNPFNPQTTIRYDLPEACAVDIRIFNIRGERVRHVSYAQQAPGFYQFVWDAHTEPSGIYIVQLLTKKFQKTQRIMLLK